MLTNTEREEIKKALEAATPGPWEFRRKNWTPGDGEWADKEFCVGDRRHEVKPNSYHTILEPQKNKYGQYDLYAWSESDALIIANAHTWLKQQDEMIEQLIAEVRAKDAEIERLRQVEADYKALQEIMDRARRLAYLAAEEEEERPRFRMDVNGNLTRVEDGA